MVTLLIEICESRVTFTLYQKWCIYSANTVHKFVSMCLLVHLCAFCKACVLSKQYLFVSLLNRKACK